MEDGFGLRESQGVHDTPEALARRISATEGATSEPLRKVKWTSSSYLGAEPAQRTSLSRDQFSRELSRDPGAFEEDEGSQYSDESERPPMIEQKNSHGSTDFCVRDLSLSDLGLRKIRVTEMEMKGLLDFRKTYAAQKPLKGVGVLGIMHVTAQTGVFVETLVELGAKVRWATCNLFSTQDEIAAAIAEMNVPIYAWNDMTDAEFFWCLHKAIGLEGNEDPSWEPHIIYEDGGDAFKVMMEHYKDAFIDMKGLVEQSAFGVQRLYAMARQNELPVPVLNINDAVVKQMFDHRYTSKESIVDSLKWATEGMLAGKICVVCGFGDIGKGCAEALRGMGAIVAVTEVDPICALQATMGGYRVVRMEEVASKADIFVTTTGSRHVIGREQMDGMKDGAIVCNMGRHDEEIDVESLREGDLVWDPLKPHVDFVIWPDGKRIMLIANGKLMYLSCSLGVPSFVMSVTFVTAGLAILDLAHAAKGSYKNTVYILPRAADEAVARHHLVAFDAHLTSFTDEQAKYLGLNKNGPFKPDFYRY
eukprot:Clim_evm7s30 gene=Clim_evmTU7s30